VIRITNWGPRTFECHHRLDLRAVVEHLNAKPSIRIELGMYVGRYRDNDYVLGPTQEGLRPAIRRVLTIKREDRAWHTQDRPAVRDYLRIRERLQAKL
jgi:hypothetical protein